MTKETDVIGAVVGIIGLITVLIGVVTFCLKVRKDRAAEDVGSVCLHERAMGLFTAKEPWAWWMGREVRILEVPTLYGVLRAGEANKWTSSLVEGIYDNLDDDVCWKRLYEQFFIQLAWNDPSCLRDPRITTITESALQRVKMEKKRIKKMPKMLELEARAENAVHWWIWLGLCMLKYCMASLYCIASLYWFLFSPKTYTYHPSHDRRFLYKDLPNRPALLKDSVRTPEAVYPVAALPERDDPLRGYQSIWDRHLRHIWIINKRPCLPVSRAQLPGFCLIFAINLTPHQGDSFHGTGAYGLNVDVSHQGDYLRIQLRHPRRGPRLQASKGNGYSVLYAKLLACRCLPFARAPGITKSIEVNPRIHGAIQRGDSIKDDARELPKNSAVDLLGELPGQTNDDFYYKRGDKTNPPGLICDEKDNPLMTSASKHFTWARAVSGIAFGGLVPQAVRTLVSAVQFTVLGTDEIGGTTKNLLDKIEELVNDVHGWNEKYEIFGSYIARRQIIPKSSVNTIFAIDPCDIADATAIFSRYTTLLERFLGIVTEKTHALINVKENVYEKLSGMLEDSYKSTVDARALAGTLAGMPAGAPPHNTLLSQVEFLKGFNSLAPATQSGDDLRECCAILARILLLAWTYQVNLICWEDDDDHKPVISIAKQQNTRLLSIDDIPDDLGALGL